MDGSKRALVCPWGIVTTLALALTPWASAQSWVGIQEGEFFGTGGHFATFGQAVAMDGDVAAAGGLNAAKIYERSGSSWGLAAELSGPGNFGTQVLVANETVGVVSRGQPAGVYLYTRSGTTWELEQFVGSDLIVAALDGDRLALGRQNETVDVYTRSGTTWSFESQVTAFDAAPGFGGRLDLEGSTLLVGATLDDSVYSFTETGGIWNFDQKLSASPPTPDFTRFIVLDGDQALFGGEDEVLVFGRTGRVWSEQQRLLVGNTQPRSATALALEGDIIAVGRSSDNALGNRSGAVTLHRKVEGTWGPGWHTVGDTIGADDRLGGAVDISQGRFIAGAIGVGPTLTGAAVFFRVEPVGEIDESESIVSLDLAAEDLFGEASALQGGTLVVGAPGEDGRGAAYVFERDPTGAWMQQAKLVAQDAGAEDAFGTCVGLDAGRILIGAPGDDDVALDAGAVYVFDVAGSAWVETQMLVAPDGNIDDQFGSSLSYQGGQLAVGAPRDANLAGFRAGSVYVFEPATGSLAFTEKLRPAADADRAKFGTSLELSGTTLVVGAPRKEVEDFRAGAVYVFEETGGLFLEQEMLVPPGGQVGFGEALDLDGDRLLVGAPSTGVFVGEVCLFERSGGSWTSTSCLRAASPRNSDAFGSAVALCGDRAYVGAPGYDRDALQTGATFAYSVGVGGQLDYDATLSRAVPFEARGTSLALEQDGLSELIAIGGPRSDPGGSVGLYVSGPQYASFCDATDGSLAACPCANPGLPETGCDRAQATGGIGLELVRQELHPQNRATLLGFGYPVMSAPGVTVLRSAQQTSAAPFGDGILCLSGGLVRVGAVLASGGISLQTIGHGAGVGPGVFHYQLWVRNSPVMFCDPGAAFNLSSGRSITW